MILPPRLMYGSTRRVMAQRASQLSRIISASKAISISSTLPIFPNPAALTKNLTLGFSSLRTCKKVCRSCRDVIFMGKQRIPAGIRPSSSLSLSSLLAMSQIWSIPPNWSPISRAICRPIPDEAPVMIAIFIKYSSFPNLDKMRL